MSAYPNVMEVVIYIVIFLLLEAVIVALVWNLSGNSITVCYYSCEDYIHLE